MFRIQFVFYKNYEYKATECYFEPGQFLFHNLPTTFRLVMASSNILTFRKYFSILLIVSLTFIIIFSRLPTAKLDLLSLLSAAQNVYGQFKHGLNITRPDSNTVPMTLNMCRPTLGQEPLPLTPLGPSAPPSLKAYASWHRRMRACFDHGSTCEKMAEVLIFHCQDGQGCGGMGDRLKGIIFTFTLAIATNRLFFIDIPAGDHSFFPFEVGFHPASIDWRLPSTLKLTPGSGLAEKKSAKDRRWLGLASTINDNDTLILNWAFGEQSFFKRPVPKNIARFDGNDIRYVNLKTNARGVLSSFKTYPAIIRMASNAPHSISFQLFSNPALLNHSASEFPSYRTTLFRVLTTTLLTPSPVVNQLVSQLSSDFQDRSFAAVHARTGDDVLESGAQRFRYVQNNYSIVSSSILSCLRKRSSSHNVFLASDSRGFKKTFLESARANGKLVKTESEKAVHIEKHKRDPQSELTVKDCKDFLNVFVDIVAMSKAHVIVVASKSGFSRFSYFLGNATNLYIAYSPDEPNVCKSDYVVLQN